ncbi:MAG: triose-phosphate isomerase [Candidatus Hodarchaeota archaeon]
MRKPIIGGNWKMNRGIPQEASEILKKLIPLVKKIKQVEIVIAPPFTVISSVFNMLKKTNMKLSAQNMYYEENGAFTGEISPNFLKTLGCEYIILGHSERRDLFNEDDDIINKKIKKALSIGLNPIVCIGEHLEEREKGETRDFIEKQFNATFKNLNKKEIKDVVIAYEPIWAIGTGKTATPDQAEEIHEFIRQLITRKYDEDTAIEIRIQYGGSIKPSNAEDLFKKENIDGGLVGGASLQAESFYKIIRAAEDSIY